jgi:hypothetical protein
VRQPPRKITPIVREDSGDAEIFLTHIRERSFQPTEQQNEKRINQKRENLPKNDSSEKKIPYE